MHMYTYGHLQPLIYDFQINLYFLSRIIMIMEVVFVNLYFLSPIMEVIFAA